MPRITLIYNSKGGVGKTTTAQALATGLARVNPKCRTLMIDYDPSANLSHGSGAYNPDAPTMYNVIIGTRSISEVIQQNSRCDIIPSNDSMESLKRLYGGEGFATGVFKLKEQLDLLGDAYTHIIIDNQPTLGDSLTMQALAAATDLVIPVYAERFAAEGVRRMASAIADLRRTGINPNLRIDGVLLTRCRARENTTKAYKAVFSQWANSQDSGVYKACIRDKKEVKDAQISSQSLFDYAPSCGPARDYREFIQQYLSTDRREKYGETN